MLVNGIALSKREEALLRRLISHAEIEASYKAACSDDSLEAHKAGVEAKSLVIIKNILGL
jgi:hypothetical protein